MTEWDAKTRELARQELMELDLHYYTDYLRAAFLTIKITADSQQGRAELRSLYHDGTARLTKITNLIEKYRNEQGDLVGQEKAGVLNEVSLRQRLGVTHLVLEKLLTRRVQLGDQLRGIEQLQKLYDQAYGWPPAKSSQSNG